MRPLQPFARVRPLAALALGLVPAAASAFSVAPETPLGALGRLSGHEEITRQAMVLTDALLKRQGVNARAGNADMLDDLDPQRHGTEGSRTSNMIIFGNWSTDNPSFTHHKFGDRYKDYLRKVWRVPATMSWHNGATTQSLHSLRNYKGIEFETARSSCKLSRHQVVMASAWAMDAWDHGDQATALYLLGHATHIIQDSFSPAHMVRESRARNGDVRDVCYFGVKQWLAGDRRASKQRAEISENRPDQPAPGEPCYHVTLDVVERKDGIWIRDSEQLRLARREWPEARGDDAPEICDRGFVPFAFDFISKKKKASCLKHEARLARAATVKYLYAMTQYLRAPRPSGKIDLMRDLGPKLRPLFEGSYPYDLGPELNAVMPGGILRCDQVPLEY